MTTIYVTARELPTGGYQVTDETNDCEYGHVKSYGDADDLVKAAIKDIGAIVVVTELPLSAQ